MAKVNAALGDVVSKYQLALPDTYRLRIDDVKEKTENGRQNFNFELSINEGEFKGTKIFHNVSMHQKNGEPNKAGEADYKRIAEAAMGIGPDDPDYDWTQHDSDDLKTLEFLGEVFIDNWIKDQGLPSEKKGQSNKLDGRKVAKLS